MRVPVNDVMTRQVVSVNGSTPFKDVAEVLIAHGVSAVPVVDAEGHVIGVVSEADLLHKEEFRELFYREGYQPPLRVRLRHRNAKAKAKGDTAAELMTAPAITVSPGDSVVHAARVMHEHDIKRLMVVDDEGRLAGVVSRHDLLKVFVRQDEDLADEVRVEVLGRLSEDTSSVRVHVEHGMVTLSGQMERRSAAEIAAIMTRRINGVVDVVNQVEWKVDDTPIWSGR